MLSLANVVLAFVAIIYAISSWKFWEHFWEIQLFKTKDPKQTFDGLCFWFGAVVISNVLVLILSIEL